MREIEDADGNKSTTNVFKGSKEDIETVRQALRGSKYEKYTDQIIDQLKIDKHNQTAAQYDDLIADINSGTAYSASDYAQAYRSAPIKKQAAMMEAITKQVDNLVNDQTAFDNAYTFVGVDKATWDQTDDGNKMLTVLDKIGGLKNAGAISSETTDKYFREWVEDQMVQIERQEDRDALVEQIQTFADKGYIGNANKLINLVTGKRENNTDDTGPIKTESPSSSTSQNFDKFANPTITPPPSYDPSKKFGYYYATGGTQ
jgi:hypothetical protein